MIVGKLILEFCNPTTSGALRRGVAVLFALMVVVIWLVASIPVGLAIGIALYGGGDEAPMRLRSLSQTPV